MPAWLWGQSLWVCVGKKNKLIWFGGKLLVSPPRVIVCLLEHRVEAQPARSQTRASK